MAAKTHRQKVDVRGAVSQGLATPLTRCWPAAPTASQEFNEYLGKLSEHHDIPKVASAGNG